MQSVADSRMHKAQQKQQQPTTNNSWGSNNNNNYNGNNNNSSSNNKTVTGAKELRLHWRKNQTHFKRYFLIVSSANFLVKLLFFFIWLNYVRFH